MPTAAIPLTAPCTNPLRGMGTRVDVLCCFLHAYASVTEARTSIGRYLDFYNRRRPHQGLAGQTPDQAFIIALPPIPAAA